ncbi:hypothetical protein ACIRBX_03330 [Kitasatospora sp. NPDC096147]|uniref:hypothetical protein n=1 Tax=Kitasatospora sp. NPDC096147 TaxID=3364093 RepID=UPI0037FC22EE
MRIDYDGRQFRKLEAEDGVVARYHQEDDLVWADFAGGPVRRGNVAGVCSPEGVLELAYTMVLDDGEVIAGRTVNTPYTGPGGDLLIREEWERYGPHARSGTSFLTEVTTEGGEGDGC